MSEARIGALAGIKLAEILNCLDNFKLIAPNGVKDIEISNLYQDSRFVTKGGLFFAIPGTKTNGTKFLGQAIGNGAVCVVTDTIQKSQITQIIVPNVRRAMSLIAKAFSGNAADELKIIAVVGTNGKTTCTNILQTILVQEAEVGIIGTLGISWHGKSIKNPMTTPDPIALHELFRKMRDDGVQTVVMEASAHAIHLNKLDGINFEAAIFTNLSRDHLDFFHTFDLYAKTKTDFFCKGNHIKTAIVNADDKYGQEIIAKRTGATVGYCLNDLQMGGIALPDTAFFKAQFNIYNALACIACARALGITDAEIMKAVENIPQIPGRFNTYKLPNGATVVIDYAHTPDGLEKIIKAVRATTKGRIITVFGCGGNRDKQKRSIMGRISALSGDFTIITSDNPRNEKPLDIIREIERGVKRVLPRNVRAAKYTIAEDRTQAINHALSMAKENDTVIIAGKGGETHTEINNQFIPYSDADVVTAYIEKVTAQYETTQHAQTITGEQV